MARNLSLKDSLGLNVAPKDLGSSDVCPRRQSRVDIMCVAKLIDGRISIPEQLLRGGVAPTELPATTPKAQRKRPPVLLKPAYGMGHSPSLILNHNPSKIVTTLNIIGFAAIQLVLFRGRPTPSGPQLP